MDSEHLSLRDIYEAAFLSLHGIRPDLTMQGSMVVFQFPSTPTIRDLLQKYNSENPSVDVQDFVRHLRRLRAQMISKKGGHKYAD